MYRLLFYGCRAFRCSRFHFCGEGFFGYSEIAPMGHSAVQRPQKEHLSGNFNQATFRLPIVSRVINRELHAATHLPQPEQREVSTTIECLSLFTDSPLTSIPSVSRECADLWEAGHSWGMKRLRHGRAVCIASGMICREGSVQSVSFSYLWQMR